jgi:hypothetical protein
MKPADLQSSTLGPLPFNVCSNGIDDSIGNFTWLWFVKDFKIFLCISNVEAYKTFSNWHRLCPYVSKGHPITGHQGPRGGVEVQLYSFSTSALWGGGWSAPRPGRFTPQERPGTHCTVGLQGQSGRVRKISPPPGFDPWTYIVLLIGLLFKIYITLLLF